MRFQLLRPLVVFAACAPLAACGADAAGLHWQLAFVSAALSGRAERIEARIVKGGCASSELEYVSAFAPGESGTRPPDLDHGNYGFIARAQDGNCYWYAGGCTEVSVPRSSGTVTVELAALAVETLDCDGAGCTSAACRTLADAGNIDAAVDEMPSRDAGADAAPPDDAGAPPVDAAPPLAPVEISLEVEHGDPINAPFTVEQDDLASGAAYCWYPADPGVSLEQRQALKRATPPAAGDTAGMARLEFDVPRAADYRLWGRVIAPSLDEDSFWLRIDEGEWLQWNDISHQDQTWHWDDVRPFENRAGPYLIPLTAGRHALWISYREVGAKLDRVVFASDPEFVPSDS